MYTLRPHRLRVFIKPEQPTAIKQALETLLSEENVP